MLIFHIAGKMFRSWIFSLLLILLTGDTTWELKKNKNNIKVYTRKVSASDFKEMKCTTQVKSSLSSIVKVLTDVNYFTLWIYKCIEAAEVKRTDDSEIYSYQLFDAPWPLDDRDVVARLKVKQDGKTKVVTAHSVLADGLVPVKEDVVRIKNFHTTYTLTPLGNGWVEIDYELGTEPGGNIPAWLANLVMVNGPFTTQQLMNGLIQTPAFKKAKFDFIEEL